MTVNFKRHPNQAKIKIGLRIAAIVGLVSLQVALASTGPVGNMVFAGISALLLVGASWSLSKFSTNAGRSGNAPPAKPPSLSCE